MSLGIESQFVTNALAIFGNNPLIIGMVALAFFIGTVALLRIPVQIAAPLYAMALIVSAMMLPDAYLVVIALVFGIVIATFVYSLWEK
jgi:glucose dehydrogenase